MFFGVSEPVEHFLQPPLGREAAGAAAARLGMAGAICHWGIHGWAIYAVAALSIAFASYNLGLPMTLRSAFYPLMGEAVWGRFGHGIDILAVLATLFGLATSLGLGAQQMTAGLAHLWGTPTTDTIQVLLIAGITGMALTSVVRGMEKGVKRLSEANLLLALLLLAFVLTVGPTRDIITGTVTSLGHYLAAIGPLSSWVGREDLRDTNRPGRLARLRRGTAGRSASGVFLSPATRRSPGGHRTIRPRAVPGSPGRSGSRVPRWRVRISLPLRASGRRSRARAGRSSGDPGPTPRHRTRIR